MPDYHVEGVRVYWMWVMAGIVVALAAGWALAPYVQSWRYRPSLGSFPSEYQREKSIVSRMLSFRPEGHDIAYTLRKPWRIALYLRKYRIVKYGIAADELDYFNRQRRLLHVLRRRPHLPADQPSARLAVVGDMMWIRTNWKRFLQPGALEYLKAFDAVIGNLETPIDTSEPPVEWYKLDAAKFNSDPALLDAFHNPDAGQNVLTALSLANNHVFDRGDEGARRTLALLDQMGIRHTGVCEKTDAQPDVAIFERNGIRFGMYGAAYGYNEPAYRSVLQFNKVPGLAPWPYHCDRIDLGGIAAAVDAMERANVDFRILYIHWGHEFELYPTPEQVQLGRKLAAMGFDLVAGSHSHVLQPSEICFVNGYEKLAARQLGPDLEALQAGRGCVIEGRGNRPRKSLIHYSLGNFTTAMLYWETKIGAIQSMRVQKDPATGWTDWDMPDTEFVYNPLAIHNDGRKEVALLADYVKANEERLRSWYPRHRRIMGYLFRHMLEPMSQADLSLRSNDWDFERLIDWANQRQASTAGVVADRGAGCGTLP